MPGNEWRHPARWRRPTEATGTGHRYLTARETVQRDRAKHGGKRKEETTETKTRRENDKQEIQTSSVRRGKERRENKTECDGGAKGVAVDDKRQDAIHST